MNKQALDNRADVRKIMRRREPETAKAIYIAVSEENRVHREHSTEWSRSDDAYVVGFGDCETDIPGRFGADEETDDH